PSERNAKVIEASVTWNYTTVLNIVFLTLAAVLVWRYFRRGGGIAMLRMMNTPMEMEHGHGHAH
ncbi:MAG: permease, partial [Actinobacteria bacterium]